VHPDPLAAVQRQAAVEVIEKLAAIGPELDRVDLGQVARQQQGEHEAGAEERMAHALGGASLPVGALERLELRLGEPLHGRAGHGRTGERWTGGAWAGGTARPGKA
jgi:hypothetical protein